MDESQIIRLFSGGIRRRLEKAHLDQEQLCEIRLRVHNPCMVLYRGEESFLDKNGGLTRERLCAYCVTGEDIKETMEHIAGYSLYAYEEEIRQGYLTVQGGHRVGIAGKAVMEGDADRGSVMAGQIAGLIKKEQSCKEIIEELVAETIQVFKERGSWVK